MHLGILTLVKRSKIAENKFRSLKKREKVVDQKQKSLDP